MLESEEELQEKMCFLIILITKPRTYTNTINNSKDIKISLKTLLLEFSCEEELSSLYFFALSF